MAIIRDIATAALRIEPSHERVFKWMLEEPIRELDGMTVYELASEGRGHEVLDLLKAVGAGNRGL